MRTFSWLLIFLMITGLSLSDDLVGEKEKVIPTAEALSDLGESSETYGIQAGIKKSAELFISGDSKGAIRILTELIKENPGSAQLLLERGKIYMNNGLCSNAIRDFDGALKLSSGNPEVEFLKADCLHLLSNNEEALTLVNAMVQKDTAGYSVYYNRGLLLFKLKKYVEALESYTKALEIDKSSSKAYAARAIAFQALDDKENAIKDINKALQIDPRNAGYFYQRADFYYRNGAYENAMADADMSIRLDGRFSPAYLLTAKLQILQEQFEAAMNNLDQAIELDPDNCNAYYSRGFLKYMLGNTVDAEMDFNSAMSRDPRFKFPY